jgi:[ribosomal protein S18]-alanine N-acetyltransferase
MNNFHIRPFLPTDMKAVLELFRSNVPTYFSEDEEEGFISFFNEEGIEYYVLEENGMVQAAGGYAVFEERKEGLFCWGLVDASMHGIGYGTALARYRIEQLKKHAVVEKIVVRTAQDTYKFYEKMGFQLISITENFWSERFHLYYMEMEVKR